MELNELLSEEIKTEFEKLSEMEIGSEKYKASVDGLTKLIDRAIEIDKSNNDFNNKLDDRDLEVKKLRDDNRDRLIRNILTGVGIAVPAIVTIWGATKSWEFERTDAITSTMGRGFMNKLLPKK